MRKENKPNQLWKRKFVTGICATRNSGAVKKEAKIEKALRSRTVQYLSVVNREPKEIVTIYSLKSVEIWVSFRGCQEDTIKWSFWYIYKRPYR